MQKNKLRKMSKTPNATLLNLSKKVHTPTVFVFCIDLTSLTRQGCWSRGEGTCPILPILADQLTLSQVRGQIMPTTLLITTPPDFQIFLKRCQELHLSVFDGLVSQQKTFEYVILHHAPDYSTMRPNQLFEVSFEFASKIEFSTKGNLIPKKPSRAEDSR